MDDFLLAPRYPLDDAVSTASDDGYPGASARVTITERELVGYPKDAVSTASQGTQSNSVFGTPWEAGKADAVSTASGEPASRWVPAKPCNAKRLKTDAVSTASGWGVMQPGVPNMEDAVSTASSCAGLDVGCMFASGRFVFGGIVYTLGQVRSIC